jgi:hypothetical protein
MKALLLDCVARHVGHAIAFSIQVEGPDGKLITRKAACHAGSGGGLVVESDG